MVLKDFRAARAKYYSERRSLMGDMIKYQRTKAWVITVIAACPLGILAVLWCMRGRAIQCPAPTAREFGPAMRLPVSS